MNIDKELKHSANAEVSTVIPDTTIRNPYNKKRVRLAVAAFFFGQGLCFSSWASRIPDLQSLLNLNEGALGTILFALPLGQLISMSFSGRLIARFGSHKIVVLALSFYALSLTHLGLATQPWHLAIFLMLFGLCSNLSNIAVNTQGIYAEEIVGKPIMSSFHGVWSIAGFTGALFGFLMIYYKIVPYRHFWIMAVIVWLLVLLNYRFLTKVKITISTVKRKRFSKPDKMLIQLGIIGFCGMASEGVMFDWSGVYFKKIVLAEQALVILGFLSFMIMMASGRFLGDKLMAYMSKKRLMQISGI